MTAHGAANAIQSFIDNLPVDVFIKKSPLRSSKQKLEFFDLKQQIKVKRMVFVVVLNIKLTYLRSNALKDLITKDVNRSQVFRRAKIEGKRNMTNV